MLFRYADFVALLGGTELHLGWIVGVGMVGSVLMRLFVGSAIDHHGPRLMWLSSLLLLAGTLFAHLGINSCNGLPIYLSRVVFCTAAAGVFGASTTFIASGASTKRMAELISMLGTSGFLGMMLGTQLGDLICGAQTVEREQIDRVFVIAGVLVTAAVPLAWWATRRELPPAGRSRVPVIRILRRYQPGMVLVVGVAGGAAMSLPPTFLRPYAAELHIGHIGGFFTVCALAAVATRFFTRRLTDRFGLPALIVFGLAVMAVSQLLFLCVMGQWWLVVPGLAFGVAQGLLYPMVTAAASSRFPSRHRGLSITLSLASFDAGQLIGSPAAGLIVHHSQSLGLPGYPLLFCVTAAVLLLVAAVYAAATEKGESQLTSDETRREHAPPVASLR